MKKILKVILCVLILITMLTGCDDMEAGNEIIDNETVDMSKEETKEETEKDTNDDTTSDPLVIESEDVQEKNLQDEPDEGQEDLVIEEKAPRMSAQILEDWTWKKEGDYTLISGSLLNDGEGPIGFFRIRAEYLNENEDVVDTDSTVYGEVVWPNHQKRFKISNKYEASHFSVRIWVDEVFPAKEPVIEALEGTNAEIIEGWSWTVEGKFSYIDGHIRNTGDKPIRYYKIIAEYGDGQGQVLDSDFTNSNDKIELGGMQDFQIMHPYNEAFQEVTIYISNIK